MQKVTGIALALVLGIGAAGCAGSDESAGGGEQVTLTLAVQAGAGNQAAYEKAIADFEAEEPDITIEPEFVGGDWSTLITTQLRGGNAPDLIDLVPGSSVPHSVLAMAKAGFLEDLAGEGWVGELAEGTRPLVSEDDAVYAWPSVVQVSGLFVNEEALSEAGVDVPTTTDELLAACQDLAEAGLTPISWNGMPVTRNGSQATTISSVTGAADPGVIEAIASGEKTFEDSREWLAAFGLIRSLSEGGCFGDGAAVATDEAANADVLGGDAAMSISNSQQAGQILQRGGGGVHLNAYPFPGATAAESAVLATPYNALAVNARSGDAEKEAARKFVAFIADSSYQPEFATLIGSLAPVDVAEGALPESLAGLEPAFDADRVLTNPVLLWAPAMYPTMSAGVQGLLTGQTTPEQVLASMDAAVE